MNKGEKLKSANQAINQGLHRQTVGRFKRPNKVCVMSTPIITERHDYRHYTPPKSTIRDHLNDCFGWLS